MAVEQKLVEYLTTASAAGRSREDIYKELLAQGWTIGAIEEGFAALGAAEEKEGAHKRTINIVATIGAILVGVGIFSFIAANWEALARPIKIAIILVAMIVAYAAGWYARERGYKKTGGALILLGAIIYGAGIFLVAQMFNIRANWPDGFILWMLGVMAMGFAAEAYALFAFAIPLGIVALIGHPFGIFTGFGHDPFLFTSSILLAAATAATFAAGVVIRKRIPPELKDFY